MKALGAATSFVILLVTGVLGWAMLNGSPLAGEPTASLQIKQNKNQQFGENTALAQGNKTLSGGRMEVMLEVAPKRQVGKILPENGKEGQEGSLLEASSFGPLPKRADNGRSPAMAYAKQQVGRRDTLPRIAILITGLGLNQRLSQLAIRKLPANVSLGFSAYGRRLPKLASQARRFGHEYILQVPMEPFDLLQTDTGPKTLQTNKNTKQNQPNLHWSLGRLTGYFGITNYKGRGYLAKSEVVSGLFKELKARGLVFFHDDASGRPAVAKLAEQVGLGYSRTTLSVDQKPTREGISKALKKLEASARRLGFAVGVVHMHPVSINMIRVWSKTLARKGVRLVPLSQAYGLGQSPKRGKGKQARNGI
ncbi:MAG: divergent polysaccharide deacetylase family protein [Hyphomicrobiaceae bacterium]|nr:divergent polysaccharide deacetylase family protein [Hyphomicrobiaceae bacterium]